MLKSANVLGHYLECLRKYAKVVAISQVVCGIPRNSSIALTVNTILIFKVVLDFDFENTGTLKIGFQVIFLVFRNILETIRLHNPY